MTGGFEWRAGDQWCGHARHAATPFAKWSVRCPWPPGDARRASGDARWTRWMHDEPASRMSRRGKRDGWVVLHDLVPTDVIDAAVADLWTVFPKPDKFHDDPARYIPPERTRRRCGAAIPRCRSTVPGSGRSSIGGATSSRSWGRARSTGCTCTRRSSTSPNARSRRVTSGCTNRTSARGTPATPTTSSRCTPIGTTRSCRRCPARRGGTSRCSCTSPTSTTIARRPTR